MSEAAAVAAAPERDEVAAPPRRRPRRRGRGLIAFALAMICVLMVPIAVMFVFSFNDPRGNFNYAWNEFSLDAWAHPLAVPELATALGHTLLVAVLAALIATLLGTPIALALTRSRLRGRGAANVLVLIPLATPEINFGAALLTFFVATVTVEPLRTIVPKGIVFPLGLNTVIIGHVTFCISFVVITVRARLVGFPYALEEAALDLGATRWVAFWKVVFPLIRPGIVAGALLAFALSIDDFVVTNFTSGTAVMFPTWLFSLIRRSLPPQIDVIGVLIFAVSIGAAVAATLLAGRRVETGVAPEGGSERA
jgi:spermidine/putrescine transport system permease protein